MGGKPRAVRLRGRALELRGKEVAYRLFHDPTATTEGLAAEYGVLPITVNRWRNIGDRHLIADVDDIDRWRQELAVILERNLQDADMAGDRRDVAMLADRLAKLVGTDFSDRIAEARVRLDAARLNLMSAGLDAVLRHVPEDARELAEAEAMAAIEQRELTA